MLIYVLCTFRDADDAVYARDGYNYDGYRLRVEFPRGGGPGSFRGGRGGMGDRGRSSRGPPARRSQFRVLVTGKVDLYSCFSLILTCNFVFRTTTFWFLARFEGSYARSW